jgi:hypothetical protein
VGAAAAHVRWVRAAILQMDSSFHFLNNKTTATACQCAYPPEDEGCTAYGQGIAQALVKRVEPSAPVSEGRL